MTVLIQLKRFLQKPLKRELTMLKILIVALFVLNALYEFFMLHLSISDKDRPLPENVKDVYNEERYKLYKAYKKESGKVELISFIVSFVINLAFLVFNVYATLFNLFDGLNIYLQYFLLIVVFDAFTTIVKMPFSYYGTFTVEEKFGMNKTTKKTFFLDKLKGFILGIILSTAIIFIMIFFFSRFGVQAIIWTAAVIVVLSLLLSTLVLPLLKLFNKFTPLANGELKDKLLALCDKYNVKVKRIVIKDASRRTTKANAFCTGMKKKTISIDDNLLNNFTTDEIVAVFAHEFAHAKYKHVIKTLPFSLIRSLLTIVLFGLILEVSHFFTPFGFTQANYFFAMILLDALIWPFSNLADMALNYISRKHEYEADAFAAKEGYGEALISALKRLVNESLSEINPHPWIVKTSYSHPTLSQRITAVRANEK